MDTPVKDSLLVFKEGARVNFGLHGKVLPAFGLNLDGEPQTRMVQFKDDRSTEKFRKSVLSDIKNGRITEFVVASEVLIANDYRSQEWLKKYGTLDEYHRKKRAVMVRYCNKNEFIQFIALVDNSHFCTLGEWEVEERIVSSTEEFAQNFQELFFSPTAETLEF